ncbi:MAG: hypothetical protein C0596_04850 [Marinilabiliales bacterium]|nr:MAG: hypothetical protein C0596_04850 [Marinilabiliales bacterium]
MIFTISSYFIGSFITSFFNTHTEKDNFYRSFVNLLSGLFFYIIGFAIIKSSGNTIMWGIIIILILYYIFNRSVFTIKKVSLSDRFSLNKEMLTPFLTIICLSIVFFFFHGSFFYNSPVNYLPHGDYEYYSGIVELLNHKGIESIKATSFAFENITPTPNPYHYPELWLSAIICSFSGFITLESIVVVSLAILNVILATGFISICRHFSKNIIVQILSVTFIFLGGLIFTHSYPIAETYVFANGWTPKVSMVSIIFVFFVISTIKNQSLSLFPLLMLPIVNISLAPAIFTSIVLTCLYYYFRKNKKTAFKYIFGSIILAIFILVFYYLNSKSGTAGNFTPENIIEGHKTDLTKPLKVIGGSIIILSILYFLYFIPPSLFSLKKAYRSAFFSELRKYKSLFIFSLLIVIVGLLFWSITHPISDSMQFFYMPGILLLNILIFIIIIISFKEFQNSDTPKNKVLSFLIIIIFSITNIISVYNSPFYKKRDITNSYSLEYITSINENIEKSNQENYLVASILDAEKINGFWSAISKGQGYFLRLSKNNINLISLISPEVNLNEFDIIDKNRILQNYNNNLFYKFAKNKA